MKELEEKADALLRKHTDASGYEAEGVEYELQDLSWDTSELSWQEVRDLYLAFDEMRKKAKEAEALLSGAEEVRKILNCPEGDLVERIRNIKDNSDHAIFYKANWYHCMGLASGAHNLIQDLAAHEGAEGFSAATHEALKAWDEAWESEEGYGKKCGSCGDSA